MPSAGIWLDACLVLVLAYYWDVVSSTTAHSAAAVLAVALYLYTRSNQLLWESVVILPSLGVQLETHRGIARRSLFVSRRFLPWSSLEDFLINEGICGWDIRYYLVAIKRTPQDALMLEVAFENILPRFPILLEVYHAVQEALADERENRAATEHQSYT